MKQINKGIICLLSGMALFVSCNDEWDAHYDRNGSVPQVSLMDLLRNDASLSTDVYKRQRVPSSYGRLVI